MIDMVPGEKTYTDREYRHGSLAGLIGLLWHPHLCANPWHLPNSTGIGCHHIEQRGRRGTYHLVSNCIPLCQMCHDLIHSAGRLRTTRIVEGVRVTFVFEKLGSKLLPNRKYETIGYHDRKFEYTGTIWQATNTFSGPSNTGRPREKGESMSYSTKKRGGS